MGRPKIPVDIELLKRLASIHATYKEIAHVLGCSVDTLERRFADVIEAARAEGKTSLRKKQYELALAGNVQLLIWLGKIVLGQTDRAMGEASEGDGYVFVKD